MLFIKRVVRLIRRASTRLWLSLVFLFESVKRWWRGLDKHFKQHWLINICIGLVIEVVLLGFRTTPVLVGFENAASDTAMHVAAMPVELGWIRPAPRDMPLVFIDVDEETWRSPEWGNGPYFAPRDKLFDLIEFAALQRPRFVVVDIAVENPSPLAPTAPDDNSGRAPANLPSPKAKQPAIPPAADDDAFVANLATLPNDKTGPPIDYIFIRSVRRPLPSTQGAASQRSLLPEIIPSKIDQVVQTRLTHDFHLASYYFDPSRDGVVRDWRLWELGCRLHAPVTQNHLGSPEVLPSVQLVISALKSTRVPVAARAKLTTALAVKGSCATDLDGNLDGKASEDQAHDVKKRIADAKLAKGLNAEREAGGPESRVFFRYGHRQSIDATFSAQPIIEGLSKGLPAPAILKEAGLKEAAVDKSPISGGVVLIGQSFDASGDNHPTPLGSMPGGLIMLNAVNSILNPGVIGEPWWPLEKGFTFLSIIGIGYIFARTRSFKANVVAVTSTVVMVVPVSLLLLHRGIWFDFALPLVGIALHRAVAELEEYVTESGDARRRQSHSEHHKPVTRRSDRATPQSSFGDFGVFSDHRPLDPGKRRERRTGRGRLCREILFDAKSAAPFRRAENLQEGSSGSHWRGANLSQPERPALRP